MTREFFHIQFFHFRIIILLVALCGWSHSPVSAADTEFYYFNPDSLQHNLAHLKSEMEAALTHTGRDINFQPFAHLVDFDRKIREKKPAFAFLPRWYFKKYGATLQLRPFLQPTRMNNATYSKVLLIPVKSNITLSNLKGHSLAMTSMGPDSQSILDRILFSHHGLRSRHVDIVMVPKDSDALLALALGQVDLALAVKENMERLSKINPKIFRTIKPLVETAPIPMPILCYTKGVSPGELQEFKEIFRNGGREKTVGKIMEILEIDAWQTVSK